MVPSEWSLSEMWQQLLEAYFFLSCKIILRFSFSEELKKYYVLARELGDPASNPRFAESLSAKFLLWARPQFLFLSSQNKPLLFLT